MKRFAIGAALVIGLALPSGAPASEVSLPSPVETGFPATVISTKSLIRARLLWRAERDDCSAQFVLGGANENGWYGFLKNHNAAGEWYVKAARKGYAKAQYKAGFMYEHGFGTIPQSMSEAYMWFTLAAAQGIKWGAEMRNEIAKSMTPEQIAEAEMLVEAWEPDPASCEKLALSIPANSPLIVAAAIKEVQRTWDRAVVVFEIDGAGTHGRMNRQYVQEEMAQIPPGTKLPTIIFIHGCKGLGIETILFGKLARWGFAVFAPDSFARTGRVSSCNSGTAQPFRHEEIRYAVARARMLPWVDADNLILLGHSEGGYSVTSFGGDGFKARVASGTDCWLGVSDSSPLLVVNSSEDKLLKWGDDWCRKADEYVRLPGPNHWPWSYPDAEKALVGFLTQHTGRDIFGVIAGLSVPPEVVAKSDDGISLRGPDSVQDVYDVAKAHCETFGKASSLTESIAFGVYTFSCE